MTQNEIKSNNNNLIAQHNDLIESFPEMSKNCLKLFELMVSRLDSTKEQREIKIRKQSLRLSTAEWGHPSWSHGLQDTHQGTINMAGDEQEGACS